MRESSEFKNKAGGGHRRGCGRKIYKNSEINQRNRVSLYFRPSIILGFDGPNVTSFLNIYEC